MTRTVVFDEAGNTGPDLLNQDQPVFALASVSRSPAAAAHTLPAVATELHFRRARKSRAGRENILRVLTDPALTPDMARTVAVHKPFSVVAKMVDLLVEPVCAANGYDLYVQGEHVALSNMLFFTLPAILGEDQARALYQGFMGMCRTPTPERRRDFVLELGEIAGQAAEASVPWLQLFAAGVARGEFGDDELSDLDPAPPCLMALGGSWAANGRPFEILHDDRNELERWKPALTRFWEPTATTKSFTLYDGRTLTFPLPVTEFKVAASHTDPRLQVADVVAGSLQLVLNAAAGRCSDQVFADRLTAETPLLTWMLSDTTVWPAPDFGPAELGVRTGATPNLADEITAWTYQQSPGE